MATEDQIINYFQYYLQIMKKAAMEKDIWQNVSEDEYHYILVRTVIGVTSGKHKVRILRMFY